jgi:hypothetical protein
MKVPGCVVARQSEMNARSNRMRASNPRHWATIAGTWSLIAAASAFAADDQKWPFKYSMDDMIERVTSTQNSRVKTVRFDDPHDGICPQSASFIYSRGYGFRFMTPVFGGLAYSNEDRESNSMKWVLGNRACRYTLTVKKFVTKDGQETQLALYNDDEIVKEKFEALLRVMAESPEARPVQPGGPIEIEGDKVIIRVDKSDPDKAGVSLNGVGFESSDKRKEYTGIFYFAPKSFTVFIADAPDYKIGYRKDAANKSHEIDIANSESRLSISLQKEVLGNGWKVVFGD